VRQAGVRKWPVNLPVVCLLLLGWCASSQGWALQPGEPAPPLDLPRLGQTEPTRLADFIGKVVYVDFWASWCGPCRQSLPLYANLYRSLAGSDFELLAVNLDKNLDDANRFLREQPVSYPVLLDPMGESARRWSVKAMPSSYLVDAEGRLAQIYYGFKPSHMERIEHDIKTLLENLPRAQSAVAGGLR